MLRVTLLLTVVWLLTGCAGRATEPVVGAAIPKDTETEFQVLARRLLARRYAGVPAPDGIRILVGRLSAGLPTDIPLPEGAQVVGSLLRSEEEIEIVLDGSQTTDEVLNL